jgi:hypothetical protein
VKAGTLPPNIEAMLWAYAYGRPMERVEVTHINPTAQLAGLTVDELAQRAQVIASVLQQVGDVEAAERALAMMNEADEQRRLEAVDGEVIDPAKAPPLEIPKPTAEDTAATLAALQGTEDAHSRNGHPPSSESESELRAQLAAALAERSA